MGFKELGDTYIYIAKSENEEMTYLGKGKVTSTRWRDRFKVWCSKFFGNDIRLN